MSVNWTMHCNLNVDRFSNPFELLIKEIPFSSMILTPVFLSKIVWPMIWHLMSLQIFPIDITTRFPLSMQSNIQLKKSVSKSIGGLNMGIVYSICRSLLTILGKGIVTQRGNNEIKFTRLKLVHNVHFVQLTLMPFVEYVRYTEAFLPFPFWKPPL